MYHMDGTSLVVTHYCAMGNQPRMRASGFEGNTIHFHFDDVTNLTSADGAYMGDLTLDIKDKDHFTESWRSIQGDKESSHAFFEYTRKK